MSYRIKCLREIETDDMYEGLGNKTFGNSIKKIDQGGSRGARWLERKLVENKGKNCRLQEERTHYIIIISGRVFQQLEIKCRLGR